MSGVKGLHQGRGRLIYAIITATRSTSLAIADVASPRKKPRNDLGLLKPAPWTQPTPAVKKELPLYGPRRFV